VKDQERRVLSWVGRCRGDLEALNRVWAVKFRRRIVREVQTISSRQFRGNSLCASQAEDYSRDGRHDIARQIQSIGKVPLSIGLVY